MHTLIQETELKQEIADVYAMIELITRLGCYLMD